MAEKAVTLMPYYIKDYFHACLDLMKHLGRPKLKL